MTRESELTNSDLREGDVLMSITSHDDIHVVLSIKAGRHGGQINVKLLNLQNENVLSTWVWVGTKLSASYKLLRCGEEVSRSSLQRSLT